MFELFIGNYENVIGTTVYYKTHNKYIRCYCSNYYFKPRMYTLVPAEDMDAIPPERASLRRCYLTSKV